MSFDLSGSGASDLRPSERLMQLSEEAIQDMDVSTEVKENLMKILHDDKHASKKNDDQQSPQKGWIA